MAIEWIKSYMTNRHQKVKICDATSTTSSLTSGVPQGSVLGPLLFILYVHDIQSWIGQDIFLSSYADDTVLSFSSNSVDEIIEVLENAAAKVLKYFASNGLVANPSKTKFLLIRSKFDKSWPNSTIKIDNHNIAESKSEKVLGVVINNKLTWNDHFEHLDSILRQKVGIIKRLSYKIPRKALLKLLDGLLYSHVRYCLPVFAQPQLTENDSPNALMKNIQVTLNDGLRAALGLKRSSKVSVEQLHVRCQTTTLNRLSVKTILKLVIPVMENRCEGLKGFFEDDRIDHVHFTRSQAKGQLEPMKRARSSFKSHAIHLWNQYTSHQDKSLNEFVNKFPC